MTKKLSIEERIEKLEKKKELLLKQKEVEERQEYERKQEEEKNKEMIKDIFKGKEEKDFLLIDPANVMAMGKIQNYDNDNEPLHLVIDFERYNKDLKCYSDIKKNETIIIYKNGRFHGKYSKEYYNLAKKVSNAWSNGKIEFYVSKNINEPLLMACDDLGFVLAPRITNEEEDFQNEN